MQATELLGHYDRATEWSAGSGLDLPAAYREALAVRQLRIARGEVPRGFKVGFTNRTIWPRYGVHAPIWGTVWDTTVTLGDGSGDVSLEQAVQPRLEPECAFGMAATPPAGASLQQLLDAIEWIAPSFEVVQSHQGWKFVAPDTVADGGLHARLLVGQRIPVDKIGRDAVELERRLACAQVTLRHGDREVERGIGSNVLDGPLHALKYFADELAACPGAPSLAAGDIVSTGTWTDAWPIAPGERWSAEFSDVLGRLEIRLR